MQTLPAMLPPLQTLRAFVAVAGARSFTVAADTLAVTQTAVSHQIAQLEEWIGGRLFVRDRRGVELTALGQGLHPEIVRALEALERALERARRSVGNPKLCISTTPEFSAQWLAPRLIDFCNRHPDIDVSVTVEYRRAGLADEDIDVAIRLSGVAEDGTEQLTADEEFAVCAPEIFSILPDRDAIRVAPLLRYDGARHTMLDWRRWHAELYGETRGCVDAIEFDGGPSYRTFTEMLDACRRGLGFALVRSSLVTDDLLAGRLMRCFTESVVSDLQYRLAIAPGRREQPGILAFHRWIFDQARGSNPA